MQEIILWSAVFIGVSALLLTLPWTRELFRPVYGELLKGLSFFVTEFMLWGWFFVKLIIRSHFDLVDNLFHKKSDYDSEAMLKEVSVRKKRERRG